MTISSTFSNSEEAYFPTDDDLGLNNLPSLSSLNPNGQQNIALRNVTFEEGERWISESFRLNQGDEISFQANLEVVGMNNIYATTRAPIAGKIEATSELVAINNDGDYTFSVKLSNPSHDEDYYHILPYTAISSVTSAKEFLDFTVSTSSSSLLLKPSHMDGILIDIDRSDAEREFLFTIPSSEITSADPSHIYLKLKTVTKEYYEYHKSLSFQLESQQGPYDAPVPTVSNIERGQGLFTAYTTSMDSIPLN